MSGAELRYLGAHDVTVTQLAALSFVKLGLQRFERIGTSRKRMCQMAGAQDSRRDDNLHPLRAFI